MRLTEAQVFALLGHGEALDKALLDNGWSKEGASYSYAGEAPLRALWRAYKAYKPSLSLQFTGAELAALLALDQYGSLEADMPRLLGEYNWLVKDGQFAPPGAIEYLALLYRNLSPEDIDE